MPKKNKQKGKKDKGTGDGKPSKGFVDTLRKVMK